MAQPGVKKALAKAVEKAGRVFIVSHMDPDGDALGSSLGLMHALAAAGKQVFVHSAGPLPPNYRFLPGLDEVSEDLPAPGWPDLCVVLDCHEPARTGPKAEEFLAGQPNVAIIDHHQGSADFGAIIWVVPAFAATAEMVLELLNHLGLELNREAATCLFVGLQTDTGSFKYSNTGPTQFLAAAQLARAGVDIWGVSQEVYATTQARLRLHAKVIDNLFISHDGQLAMSMVSLDELAALGAKPTDLENMVEELRAIRGVRVAAVMRELKDGRAKASLRGKGQVDVSAVALEFGGGGHHNAAGLRLPGPLNAAWETLAARLGRALDELK